jgi:hypothetical protein
MACAVAYISQTTHLSLPSRWAVLASKTFQHHPILSIRNGRRWRVLDVPACDLPKVACTFEHEDGSPCWNTKCGPAR